MHIAGVEGMKMQVLNLDDDPVVLATKLMYILEHPTWLSLL